jgi:hypothetical protein
MEAGAGDAGEWAVLGGALLGAAVGGIASLVEGVGGGGGGAAASEGSAGEGGGGGGFGEGMLHGAGVGALTGLIANLAAGALQDPQSAGGQGGPQQGGAVAAEGGGVGLALQRLLDSTLQAPSAQAVRGASADAIARLPTTDVREPRPCGAGGDHSGSSGSGGGGGGGGAAKQEPCAICMEELAGGQRSKTLPCFHVFHAACVDQWLAISAVCPVCKHELQ